MHRSTIPHKDEVSYCAWIHRHHGNEARVKNRAPKKQYRMYQWEIWLWRYLLDGTFTGGKMAMGNGRTHDLSTLLVYKWMVSTGRMQ